MEVGKPVRTLLQLWRQEKTEMQATYKDNGGMEKRGWVQNLF